MADQQNSYSPRRDRVSVVLSARTDSSPYGKVVNEYIEHVFVGRRLLSGVVYD